MMNTLFCITGASRGLGKALAETLCQRGNALLLVSRGVSSVEHDQWTAIKADLAQSEQVEQVLDALVSYQSRVQAERIVLINNAGIVEPVGAAVDNLPHEIMLCNAVNLVAPMLLTSGLLKRLPDLPMVIVNISSGAAHSAYHGWSSYCSSKAGLDHFTRCVGLELSVPGHQKIVSIAPGIVDTDMQGVIRNSNRHDFPTIDKFLKLKQDQELTSPQAAATRIVDFLNSGSYENGGIYDIRKQSSD